MGIYLYPTVFLFILSPYLLIGGVSLHSGYMAMALALCIGFPVIKRAIFNREYIKFICALFGFSAFHIAASIFLAHENNANLLVYFLNLSSYILFGMLISSLYIRRGYSYEDAFMQVSKVVLFVVLVNSIVIVVAYYFPPIKMFTESILSSEGANINYAEREERLRGLASGGAANLSLMQGAAVTIAVALYIKGRLLLPVFLLTIGTILFSLLYVGRTGYLVAAIGVFTLIASSANIFKPWSLLRLLVSAVVVIYIAMRLPQLLDGWVKDATLDYSLRFMYDGVEGFRNEGTTEVLSSMYTFPDSWIALIFGAGEHSGSFTPGVNADPGYMKMLTALGFPGAILFYLFVAYSFRHVYRLANYKALVIVLISLLFVAELKEPFVLKGYYARYIWMICGFSFAYIAHARFQIRQGSSLRIDSGGPPGSRRFGLSASGTAISGNRS